MGKEKQEKKQTFLKIALILAIILVTWLLGLSFYLGTYEKNNPLAITRTLFETIKNEDYTKAMELYNYDEDGIYTEEDFKTFINNIYGTIEDIEIYELAVEKTDTSHTYEVTNNGEVILKLLFTQKGKTGIFGITKYDVSVINIEIYQNPTIITPTSIKEVTINEKVYDEYSEIPCDGIYEELNDEGLKPTCNLISLGDEIAFNPTFNIDTNGEYTSQTTKLNDNTWQVNLSPIEENEEYFYELTTEAAQTYAKYLTEDLSLYTFRNILFKDTSYYEIFDTYANYWYTSHESYRFEDIKNYNTIIYDENHFSSETDFTHIVTKSGKE